MEPAKEPDITPLASNGNAGNAGSLTEPVCASKGVPPASEALIVFDLAREPDTILLPSGESETDMRESGCLSKGSPAGFLVLLSASQTLTDLSSEPETICLPSGENATDLTE
jgi:hypothetical protein